MSGNSEGRVVTYRDLDVWVKSMELVEEVYRISARFPSAEQFGLTAQIRRSVVSIPSNIAEGHGRQYRGDYLRHVAMANGSLKECETQLILAGRLDFVTREDATRAWDLMQDIGKMLNRLMTSLKH